MTKIISLKIGGHRFVDLQLPFFKKEKAEIIALQEAYKSDVKELSAKLDMNYSFLPLRKRTINDEPGDNYQDWGLGTLSKYTFLSTKSFFYEEKDTDPIGIQ
jgi:hypothetical protein